MQAKFNDTMNTTGYSIAEQITEGEYYAVLYNSTWHRVRISSPVEEDGTVTCFMVDTGELYNVSKDQICNLEPVFMKTKLQVSKIYVYFLLSFIIFCNHIILYFKIVLVLYLYNLT